MDLAVIGDFNFEKVFDEVLPKGNYYIAKIGGEECAFLKNTSDVENNFNTIKNIGARRVLEFTNNEINKNKVNIAESMGLLYSGFSVSGEKHYIKPLIKIAMTAKNTKEDGLTERETEVLGLIGKGMTNKEIAKKLFLSEKTVKNHLNNIFKKIDVADRTNAALYAIKNGIV